MKASKLFFTAALLTAALGANAKVDGFTPDSNADFNRIYGAFTVGRMHYDSEYVTYTFDREFGASGLKPLGFSLGYTHAFNLTGRELPLFLEAGGEINYQRSRIKNINTNHVGNQVLGIDDYSVKENHITGNYLSIAVPINITYLFPIANGKMAIAPFFGVNFKFNALGKEKTSSMTYSYRLAADGTKTNENTNPATSTEHNLFKNGGDKDSADKDYNCHRFQVGLNMGVNVYWHQWMVGYRFQPDMTRYKNEEASNNPNVIHSITTQCHYFTVGYNF